MAELTKEWLKQTIAEYEANRDELPFGLDTNSAIELQAFKLALASLEAEPVSQTYNLPELIEGMEVSIDVSTCDADLGNRYFGTVTEALELDTAKNGYILLVQDAEPNFDVNGNSPGTPDSWISCSDRMPEKYDFDIWVFSLSRGVLDGLQWDGSMFTDDEYQFVIHDATHWMRKAYPAAPQQEVE